MTMPRGIPTAVGCFSCRIVTAVLISILGRRLMSRRKTGPHKGAVIYVPRGTRHKAIGKLTILTICIPPGVVDDIHELD